MDIIFDTETTGFFHFKKPANDPCQPDLVQLGIILAEGKQIISKISLIVTPEKKIDPGAEKAHGLSEEFVWRYGVSRKHAVFIFHELATKADTIITHNVDFDMGVMATAYLRETKDFPGQNILYLRTIPTICTMKDTTDIIKAPGGFGGNYKWPKLEEAYKHFCKKELIRGSHDALEDATFCHEILCSAREQGYLNT